MRRLVLWTAAAAALVAAAFPQPAAACGGFFCSSIPIDQAGEEIIFDIRDGKVQAHVEIQYVGDAKDFSWVVPVHGVPTLKVGAPLFFRYVGSVTQPRFNVQWEQDASCTGRLAAGGTGADSSADAGTSAEGGVTVLAQGQVGPYQSAVLGATDAEELKQWLTNNGYVLNDASVLEPYIGQGYNFLALRLQQDRTVGELRPVVIEFGGALPCIPIRLTAVAAQPDMPIIAYVFSNARAVPVNYRHVLINETRINWISNGSNYTEVATRAVDEAGGRAFLTEYAGPTTAFRDAPLWQLPGPDLDTAALATHTHPVDFMAAFRQQNFPRGDGAIFALFQRFIPLPASLVGKVSEQQFYNFIEQYRSDIDNDPNRIAFDAAGLANALQTTIVEPLLAAREILGAQPYLTRLYTTMSANEMTVDPEFDFNTSAPEVSNVHTAQGRMFCDGDGRIDKAELTLSDGRKYVVDWNTATVTEGPFAARVEQYTATGAPALIQDNSKAIDLAIKEYRAGFSGCGCGAAGGGPLAALMFAGLSLWRARRRGGH